MVCLSVCLSVSNFRNSNIFNTRLTVLTNTAEIISRRKEDIMSPLFRNDDIQAIGLYPLINHLYVVNETGTVLMNECLVCNLHLHFLIYFSISTRQSHCH